MQLSPRENITMALSAVWSNRFRSMLTILGIVIGITTVVTVASLLTGLRAGMVTFFQELGPDNIFIYKTSGDPNSNFASPKERKRRAIKKEYADTIKRYATNVEEISLALFIPGAQNGHVITAKVPGFETDTLSMIGVTPNAISTSPKDFDQGRYFTDEENERVAHVAVVGFDLAKALYPDGNAVGRTFMLDGAEFTVIGVFAKAKGGFFGSNNADTQIQFPLKTAESRYPQVDRYMITCKGLPGHRKDALDEVDGIMRRIRGMKAEEIDDFSISTPDQIIQQFDKITGLIGLIAIAISGLGLLVGGIGVMNIMLVSVTERTREIGIRKAIGARRFDIIGQFLAEAMTLTGVGGVLGIVISILLTMLVGALVPALPSSVPTWAVVTAFSVSVAVGLFFGVWPAVKASRLDPVEALRYE
ncbi:MAG: putative transport system permease protein [Bryobacterales bacterium]|jgi:putative ABC transport system permease protein|nr:putative transport system permease protein [Bryobacterales bacterium]